MKVLSILPLVLLLLSSCSSDISETEKIKAPARSALPKPAKEKPATTTPKAFVSEEGGFSIQFPDEPKKHEHDIASEIGQLKLTQFLYSQDGTQMWLASYSDYPKKMIQLGNHSQLLKGIKYKVLNELHASTLREDKVKFEDNYDGITFVAHADKNDLDILYHIYLVDNRVYQLSMYSSIGEFSSQDSLDFLGSFKLLKEENNPPS